MVSKIQEITVTDDPGYELWWSRSVYMQKSGHLKTGYKYGRDGALFLGPKVIATLPRKIVLLMYLLDDYLTTKEQLQMTQEMFTYRDKAYPTMNGRDTVPRLIDKMMNKYRKIKGHKGRISAIDEI